MQVLIWIGTGLALAGVVGLLWCIMMVVRARRANLEEAAMKAKLQRAVIWNLAALMTSALGLMMVVMGVMLS